MRRIATILTAVASSALVSVSAQTLNIRTQGNVSYAIPAEQAQRMEYSASGTMTVMGKALAVADVASMKVDNSDVTDNTVTVIYEGTGARVVVAGNIMRHVDAVVEGARVSISQISTADADITYVLTGSSDCGSLSLSGSANSNILLQGVTLTSAAGAAIDIQSNKVTTVTAAAGTVSALADVAGGSHKGALYCKGNLVLNGAGTLTVTGNSANGIHAKGYIVVDGLTLGADVSADAAKAIKAGDYLTIASGAVSSTAIGNGVWSEEDVKTKAAACLAADGNLTVAGGAVTLRATGSGGKGVNCDADFGMTGGRLDIATSGGILVYSNGTLSHNYTGNTDNIASDMKSSPKGIKADGNVNISGGLINVTTTGNGAEGIESKSVLTVTGGTINAHTTDDALNSSGHMYIKGGEITAVATGNDALDSNGNLYIEGGLVRAFGARAPECGLDANEEEGYHVIFTGGTVLAVGGSNSVPVANGGSTQAYVSGNAALSEGQTVTLKSGTTVLAEFTVPAGYTATGDNTPPAYGPGGGGPGGGGPGGGPGGSQGGSVLITCPGLTSGTSYTLTAGTSSSTVTAQMYGSSGRPF